MRILLVDDDKSCRESVRWFLIDQGHDVTESTSGEEALTQYALADFHMILSDIKMAGMSGLELLDAIKKLPDSWRTDVVLYSGYADAQSVTEALKAGAYDFLGKPIDACELATVIDRIAGHQTLLREDLESRLAAE